MASDISNYCLVCSEVVSSTNYDLLDNFESVFLLRILLEIPQDCQIINQAQFVSNSLPLCKPCGVTVKQCKQVYTEISADIQKFWEHQNIILTKIHKENGNNRGHKLKQYWVDLYREFVKNSKFSFP